MKRTFTTLADHIDHRLPILKTALSAELGKPKNMRVGVDNIQNRIATLKRWQSEMK